MQGHETILLKMIVYTIAQSVRRLNVGFFAGWRLNCTTGATGAAVGVAGSLFTASAQGPERTKCT
ncbi:hypothetical protein BR499_11310 [Salmonella enterica subsp. enterica serovar Uganda]|uniref:Uncharacterized protein n=2 Tax=Salmonella enterica I TaxID=59201 RepID=A0A657FRB9_SALET|nr:hypothetical protein [Salmonella enterica]EAW1960499.1 hypothetical protein [Salmonella enterica subsp. enterica]EBZ5927610.1 hypothetical protein [Salmonella enterica subsp. enterica serovar Weslaco]EBZ6046143.1 hypothetical protein [Salmonella enterica subsp. enterica serovar Texas]ECS6015741.1 hypothetical protein [Salmonella enterica subsp. enterica serovar Rough O:k:1,5]ECS7543606.1 hypothetical protein [Salmonella enterica subsp. enterica serovar Denver]